MAIVIIIWISEIIAEQILHHLLHIIPTLCTTVLEDDNGVELGSYS